MKRVNYATFSEYCVESRDRNACCYKIRIYIALALYTLILHGDWISTKQLHREARIPYDYIAMALRALQRYGLVERVYVPGVHGIASLWRVREDALNGLDKEQVLNTLKKHIEMCLASTESSKKLSTTATATANVVIELPEGPIRLSLNELKELIARVSGSARPWNELTLALPPRLRQVLEALRRHGIIYYNPSIGAWVVSLLRLRQVAKVYQKP